MITVNKFFAPWCSPCKMLNPVFDKIEEEYEDKEVEFVHINIDENQEKAAEANVRSVPIVTFNKDGLEQNRILGAQPKKRYTDTLDLLLAGS